MKIKARVVTPDGWSESKKIVEVVGFEPRRPSTVEKIAVLTWARDRGVDTVSFLGQGPHTLRTCRGEPCDDGPNLCEWCTCISRFTHPGFQLVEGEQRYCTLSSEELEHRAQLAERLSVRLAETAIRLQGLANSAESDSIEIAEAPANG